MKIIVIIAVIWISRTLIRAYRQAREQREAERIYYERQRQQEIQAARAAALREEWRQRQLEAKAETMRLVSAERARAEREKAERRDAERAQKEAEKARKAAFEKEQAEADMEHYAVLRSRYMDLYDTLEAELRADTTTDKRRITIQRQLLQLEEKLYSLDCKRSQAYYITMKGAC